MNPQLWTSLSAVADWTTCRLFEDRKLPEDSKLEFNEVRSIALVEIAYLVGAYKPGKQSMTTWIFEWLGRRVTKRVWAQYEKEHRKLEEDIVEEHKSLMKHIEDRDMAGFVEDVAGNQGLTCIVDCLKNGMTEREIADELGTSKSKVHADIDKLRKMCKTMLDYDLANAQKTLASV